MDAENIQTMRSDVQNILDGPNFSNKTFYILASLSDLLNLVNDAISKPNQGHANSKPFGSKFPNDHFPDINYEPKSKLKKYVRKIDYFLSYTKDFY